MARSEVHAITNLFIHVNLFALDVSRKFLLSYTPSHVIFVEGPCRRKTSTDRERKCYRSMQK